MYCDKCKYLNITENKQKRIKKRTGKKRKHKCFKYDKELLHLWEYPRICSLDVCIKENGFKVKKKPQ